jgi:hypothetical protein
MILTARSKIPEINEWILSNMVRLLRFGFSNVQPLTLNFQLLIGAVRRRSENNAAKISPLIKEGSASPALPLLSHHVAAIVPFGSD